MLPVIRKDIQEGDHCDGAQHEHDERAEDGGADPVEVEAHLPTGTTHGFCPVSSGSDRHEGHAHLTLPNVVPDTSAFTAAFAEIHITPPMRLLIVFVRPR